MDYPSSNPLLFKISTIFAAFVSFLFGLSFSITRKRNNLSHVWSRESTNLALVRAYLILATIHFETFERLAWGL